MADFDSDIAVDVPVLDESKETGMSKMKSACGVLLSISEVQEITIHQDEYMDSIVPHNALSENNVVGLGMNPDPTPDVQDRNPEYLYEDPGERYVRHRYSRYGFGDGTAKGVPSAVNEPIEHSEPVFAFVEEITQEYNSTKYVFYLPTYNTRVSITQNSDTYYPYFIPIPDEVLAQKNEEIRVSMFAHVI